jgi:hypothetical protein
VRAGLICLRLRVYTGRPNRADRLGNIVGSKTPCQDHGCSDKLDDAAADRPIVGHAKRANLAIGWLMAVQEQEIDNPIRKRSRCFLRPRRARFA